MTCAGSTPVNRWSRPWNGKRQLFVVDAQLVQDRGMQVADGNRILHDVVAEIVGLAVR